MSLKVTEVFVPGSYPQHTYVTRVGVGHEQALRDALDTGGLVISLSGPSKSGKTVLVEKVVGRDYLIPITGSGIHSPDDLWNRVLDWMDVPNTTSHTENRDIRFGAEVGAKGSVGVPLVTKGEVSGLAKAEIMTGGGTDYVRERHGLNQVVHEIAKSDFVVLIDDFHYMERTVQQEVAKSLKEAVRLGVHIITASVSHRGDDVVRANPELRGRVKAVDLKYWNETELKQIAISGFEALNTVFDPTAIEKFVSESAGSPQLMQLLCLQACFVLDIRERQESTLLPKEISLSSDLLPNILEQTSSNTNFRSLVDVLEAGPMTRGTERKTYKFKDGSEGDVYRVVLKSLASDPPQLSHPYDELLKRTVDICRGESPVGSSVTGTCLHMSKLAQERFPSERAIDWDESKQVLEIPDPYLLFYLRWSERLREA